jgi:HSP20 family protein
MNEKDLMSELAEIRKAFDEFFVSKNPMMMVSDPYWRPPMDVFDTPEFTLVRLEIAGIDREDIDISLEGKKMIISGRRTNRHEDNPPPSCYRQMEIKYTTFRREVFLQQPFHEEGIEATYKNGFLEIRIPSEKPRPQTTRIKINVKETGK